MALRILYLSLSYVPSRRASSVQVMKMCAAFARRGHEVVLVAKAGTEPTDIDDHAFYRVENSFRVEKLARPTPRGGGIVYGLGLLSRVVRGRGRFDLVYSRDPVGAWIARELGLPLAYEIHEIPQGRWLRAVLRRAMSSPATVGMVAISEALRHDAIAAALVAPGKPVVVAHDASDPPAQVSRAPRTGPPRIGYVGSLYPGRGIEMIAALASRMPSRQFVVVGGSQADLARWRAAGVPPNLELVGFRPQAELPGIYAALDVVLLPHAASGVAGASGGDISRWTSPMKLFEYMASGVPLVASDLPVLQEVIRDGHTALIAPAANIAAWSAAIDRLLSDRALAERLSVNARREIEQRYTWDARAERVLAGLGLEDQLYGEA